MFNKQKKVNPCSVRNHGYHIWPQSGSDWPQMGQIREIFRSDSVHFGAPLPSLPSITNSTNRVWLKNGENFEHLMSEKQQKQQKLKQQKNKISRGRQTRLQDSQLSSRGICQFLTCITTEYHWNPSVQRRDEEINWFLCLSIKSRYSSRAKHSQWDLPLSSPLYLSASFSQIKTHLQPGDVKFGIQIGSDWHQMGQIWDFLRSVSVHFGLPSLVD